MEWGRDANFHFIELAIVEMTVNENNIGSSGPVAPPQMIGAIVDSPPAPRSTRDLNEAGGFRIAAGAERRVENELRQRRFLTVQRCDPFLFRRSLGLIRPSVLRIHHPEIAGHTELLMPIGLGFSDVPGLCFRRGILTELPEVHHIRRFGRVGGAIERMLFAAGGGDTAFPGNAERNRSRPCQELKDWSLKVR